MSGASSFSIDAKQVLCILPDAQWAQLASDWQARAPKVRFEHVDSGEEGLARMGELRPALVIVGMGVEDMEGLEFLACAMSQYKGYLGKVIVYPGDGDPFSPVAHYRDTTSGRSVTEELELGGVGEMIAALSVEEPAAPVSLAKPATAQQPLSLAKPATAQQPVSPASHAKPAITPERVAAKPADAPVVAQRAATSPHAGPASGAIRPSPIRALALGVPTQSRNVPLPPALPPKSAPAPIPPPPAAAAPPMVAAPPIAPPQPAPDPLPAPSTSFQSAAADARATPAPPLSPLPESVPYAASFDAPIASVPGASPPIPARARKPPVLLFGAAGAALIVVLALGVRHCMSGAGASAVPASSAVERHAPSMSSKERSPDVPPSESHATAAASTSTPVAEPDSLNTSSLTTLPLSFDRGRADFSVDDATRLDALVGAFGRALAAHPNTRVEVGGHTSSEGGAQVNRALGRERALLARRYLVEHSIPEERTTIVNYAATRPASTGTTMEANRRVTLRIVQ